MGTVRVSMNLVLSGRWLLSTLPAPRGYLAAAPRPGLSRPSRLASRTAAAVAQLAPPVCWRDAFGRKASHTGFVTGAKTKRRGYAVRVAAAAVSDLAGTTPSKYLTGPEVQFVPDDQLGDLASANRLVIVGKKATLLGEAVLAKLPSDDLRSLWAEVVEDSSDGPAGSSTSFVVATPNGARHVVAVVLPAKVSRHNCPAAPHALTSLLSKVGGSKGETHIILALEEPAHAFASGCAVARSFPLLSMKSKDDSKDEAEDKAPLSINVGFLSSTAAVSEAVMNNVQHAADSIRFAQRLVDAPPADMTTDRLVEECEQVAAGLPSVTATVFRNKELVENGLGGIVAVGAAAARDGREPAMVVLAHQPENVTSDKVVAWVGKGIVYDTGGLSLKVGGTMPGMKADMGGSAGMLAAFRASVLAGCSHPLVLVMCIAENAIGPGAVRPDDVITFYSGKTVEINNTDAEGRLVLGDGVAYAAKNFKPDVLVDMATLTGAQLVTTGLRHAAVMSDSEELEKEAVAAGVSSGDLTHPLIYCPEFTFPEFKSEVADMKNSVKNRMNAQSSCAGQFIAEHLPKDFEGSFLHIDMAGPSVDGERGTGYGVALLMEMIGLGSKAN